MFDWMNEMSELIYVVDCETYELLFMNLAGQKMFGIDSPNGLKCHKVMHGKDEPCEYCTNRRLDRDTFFTWEITNPLVHRHYLLKDKLVDWEGRNAKVEIAFDVTEREVREQDLKNALAAEHIVMDCVKLLHNAQDRETLSAAMEDILSRMGDFMEAERTHLFSIREDALNCELEWCAFGIDSQVEKLRELPVSLIDRWRAAFDSRRCFVVRELAEPRGESPAEYEKLLSVRVKRLVAAPYEIGGVLAGFIEVVNPPADKIKNICAPLSTLAYFISSSIEQAQSRERLERLSYYDTVTGTLNRNAYMRDIDKFANEYRGPVGAVYVDVNGMKGINDKLGHPYGDRVLLHTAQKVTASLTCCRLYRVGGDEFVAICKQNIRDFDTDVRNLKLSFMEDEECPVAIGYQWSDCGADIQKVIFEADDMMYEDKKRFYRGKVISRRYRHGNDDILGITKPGALTKLLEEERFLIYFQPKFSVETREPIGAEALVRFQTPNGVIIPPDQFIPLLEETRLIPDLDFYIFDTVCGKIREWLDDERRVLPVSVNFSRSTLSISDFRGNVEEIQARWQVPQKYVELEVTESAEADDNFDFLNIIEQTRNSGFSISIDDFGVKYANLSLFTTADFDVLKIDKSLVNDLTENRRAQAVIQSITDICNKMNVQLVVEGVETEGQLEILREMNCHGVQGYLFSRPLPLKEYEQNYLPKKELLPV